jgi:hypothetical protein
VTTLRKDDVAGNADEVAGTTRLNSKLVLALLVLKSSTARARKGEGEDRT